MTIVLEVFAILIASLIAVVTIIYLYFRRQYTFWDELNIPHTKPTIPFGDVGDLFRMKLTLSESVLEIYRTHCQEKVFGFWIMHRPTLLVNDLDLVKAVLVQDFMHFHDRGNYFNEKDDPLSAHIFSLRGSQWKNLRAKLSPTLTSGKIKNMFPILVETATEMQKLLEPLALKGNDFEAKEIIARFSTDVIASCAFGIQANSLQNPNAVFRAMGSKIFEPTVASTIKNLTSFLLPDICNFLKLIITPKDVSKFFLSAVKETMEYREKNDVKRHDFMDLMIQLKNKGFIDDVNDNDKTGDVFTVEQAAAQAFIFFIGGFETSSSTLQFTLYELSKQQDVQDKLRAAINSKLAESGGEMTYENVTSIKYMDMVLEETLRKYPPAPFLMRECTKDYSFAGTNITIKEGTPLFIPVIGIQNNPAFFPNPDVFDPERFSDDQKARRNKYTYIPFGEGPRFCIGERFAQLQMKVALVALLSKYKIEVCDKTPKKIKLDPKSFIHAPMGGMHLKIVQI